MPKPELNNRPGSGVLFYRTRATGNQPTIEGGCNIDGVEYEIAAWQKTSKGGKDYISLSIKPAGQARAARPQPAKVEQNQNGDDDIPF